MFLQSANYHLGENVNSSLTRKRVFALFALAAMFINSFGVSCAGIKGSLSLALIGATHNAVVSFIGKCNKELAGVAGGVREYIEEKIFGTSENKGLAGASEENEDAENSGAQENGAVITVQQIKEIKKAFFGGDNNALADKVLMSDRTDKIRAGLFKTGGSIAPVLLFLLFIIGIRQRKGKDAIALFNNLIVGKRISA